MTERVGLGLYTERRTDAIRKCDVPLMDQEQVGPWILNRRSAAKPTPEGFHLHVIETNAISGGPQGGPAKEG